MITLAHYVEEEDEEDDFEDDFDATEMILRTDVFSEMQLIAFDSCITQDNATNLLPYSTEL